MQLPELAVRNHQFTWVMFLLLLLLGVVSFFSMPRSEDPQFDFSAAVVKVVNPGTTPLDMEKLVADPIEQAINELDDLRVIKTNIEDGLVVIRVEFLYGTDPEDKYDDVVAAVGRVRADLPDSIVDLDIDKISPADVSILQLALTAQDASYRVLQRHADALEQRLERVAGVKRVDVAALPQLEVQVQADQRTLNALGISVDEIYQVISQAAANTPGGHVNAGARRFTVRTSGDFSSLQQIRDTPLRAQDGRTIYVRDLARVQLTEGLPSYRAKFNGEKAVFLSVVQRKGSQIFDVMAGIDAVLNDYQPRLNEGVRVQRVMDQSVSVERQISGFFSNLNQGLVLVAVLALLVLGWRPALVVVTAIPLSIFIAIGWVDFSGFGLQQMSIVGLVIALGLLVDNAIVVVENVSRHLRDGDSSSAAAIEGSRQVAWAVTSGTLTTVLAFLPMLLLQNGSGTFMRAMPVTVTLTLFASLLIALMLTPLLASKIARAATPMPKAQQALERFASTVYLRWLNKALKYPARVMVVSIALLVASLSLFPAIGVSLFPKAEKPMILVNIDMPEGTSFADTQRMANRVEAIVSQQELVVDIAQNVGRGNPRIYYNIFPSRQTVNFAQLFVTLKTSSLDDVEPLVVSLRSQLADIAGAQILVKEFLQGPPIEAPVSIRVIGEDLDELQRVSRDIADLMDGTPGVVGVDNPVGKHKVDLHVNINRDKAAMLGIPLNRIDKTIRTALVGATMGSYRDDEGEEFPLTLRFAEFPTPQLAVFDGIYLTTASGSLMPLKQVAEIELQTSIARFQHYNTERMARVTADVIPGYTTEAVTNAVVERLQQYDWPAGMRFSVGGEQENRKEAFGGMTQALILTVFGIFAVLVLQFHSFVQPLIVFAAIPFALIGALVALYITGYTFSFTAFIGLTSLIGIVVNNSIILVDYANQMRKDGMEKLDAIAAAARTRFVPIVLTTLTTIGGLLPLTLSGSSMWSPMGWAIIGGLLVSTLLTLIVVPVLYQYLGRMNQDDLA
ncbi:multidrug transporter [Bacterioplanes sanyensis]|uniref:Multidrug transporter n=1 Tax=Bacterioplanes sanyensis TaxID=1249553 RepID=A0A222FPB1_9GAMM|nr:efflux RND transporter permease subunit [Bacterioplanes sanyensis]ASP40221.1 multidrug transporter [Bacterioplanes sanyensis]